MAKYSEMEKYLSDIKKNTATKKTYEDPGYEIEDVLHKLDTFKAEVNYLLTNPALPAPKGGSSEAKKEDADMKNEEKK